MNVQANHWKATFFTIYAGQVFSLLGSAVAQFCIIWWLTVNTGSALVLTTASIAAFLPQALLGPFIGTLVDRYDRKKIMIGADMTVAATSLILAVMFMTGEPAISVIYVMLGIRSLGAAFHMPSMQASIPLIAPQEELTRVAGWNQLLFSASTLVGPMLGAVFVEYWTMTAVMMMDVIGAVLASSALLFVRIPRPERSEAHLENAGVWQEMKLGLKELMKNKGLFVMTFVIAITTFIFVPVGALFNLMTLDHFGGGAWHAGIVELSFGAGMLIGSVLLGTWGANKTHIRLIRIALLLMGIALIGSGLLPSYGYIGFVFLSALIGVSGPLFGGPYTVMMQTLIDPALLGRVMSFVNSISLLATPIGLLAAGPLAEKWGVPLYFLVSGLLIVILALLFPLQRSVRELRGGGQEDSAPHTATS